MSSALSAAQRLAMTAMLRVGPYAPKGAMWKAVGTLRARGFVTQLGRDVSFILTHAGGKALRDHYAAAYARHGSIASMKKLEEIDQLLANKRLAA